MNKKILKKTLAGVFAFAIAASSVYISPPAKLNINSITASAASADRLADIYGDTYKSAFEKYFKMGGLFNLTKLRKDYIIDNYDLFSEDDILMPDCMLDQAACQASGSESEVQISLNFADRALKFCEENGISLFGSTFVWYSQTPDWFFREGFKSNAAYVDKETMNKRLESFIKNTFEALKKEYPDLKIDGYEVCKEVFVSDGGGMRPAAV